MNEEDIRIATQKARQAFLEEADDLIVAMESALLGLESELDDAELLNGLFRAAHTIKGSGGMFGLDALVRFTHRVETVLDHFRSGRRRLGLNDISTLLKCVDQIADLLRQAREHPDAAVPAELDQRSEVLAADLEGGGDIVALDTTDATARELEMAEDGGEVAESRVWHISLRFVPETFNSGIDPFATIRYLATLGEIQLVETIDNGIPRLSQIDPERCYLGFEIRLSTRASKAVLEDAFEFIREECGIHLIPHGKSLKDYLQLIEDLPGDAERVGEILVACGALTSKQLHESLARQHLAAAEENPHVPIGVILQRDAGVSPDLVDAAVRKQQQERARKTESNQFFRVRSEKVDSLIDMVGELLVLTSTAQVQAAKGSNPELSETVDYLKSLVDGMRGSAMSLRMVAVGETFDRFRRVVRDTAKSLGKSVQLHVSGSETELDKVVVEKIADPLMHLVRNAMDHGIESPQDRSRIGKPVEGNVSISARHSSGSIVIAVSDDGRGIDPERVLAKARERGLVKDADDLSHEQILNLVFEPGFSTAEQVSDISGRGVGMDVVRRNIEALHGSVSIQSVLGQGSCITISLPLTMAIIDGFLVRCGQNHFVLPMEHVEECIDLERTAVNERAGVIMHRGHPLPVLNLSHLLGVPAGREVRKSAVVVRGASGIAGLQVDRLLGEQQAVIKPLGPLFERLEFVAGSSVLGSGDIALILDVPAVLREAGTQAA